MTFINASFLWALPFALAPVVIHYLMRFRALKVVWGANYVLERALKRLRKKLRVDQVLLIALRVLAAALLVVAFARPSSNARNGPVSTSGIHHVVLVQGSYGMLAGEPSRWERGKETLKQLTATWARGETWSLCLLASKPTWVVDAQAIQSAQQTATIIDALSTSETALPISRGIEAVRERFPRGNIELTILTGDQASAWKGSQPFPPGTAIYWIDPPLNDHNNLAVTSARFESDWSLAGQPCHLFATIRNFSDEPFKDTPVDLLLDGAFFARESVSLAPRQERSVRFDARFDKPGSHYATVRLGKDALGYDNTMSAGIEVGSRLSVLMLRDKEKSGKFDSAWEFLRIAGLSLAPLTFSLAEGSPRTLAGADAVFIDGGCALTPGLVSLLREYVVNGGALVLAADENVDAQTWNALFGNARLLPAPLGTAHREPIGGAAFQSLAKAGLALSPLRSFETDEDGDLSAARFYAWRELGPIPEGTEVLSSFSAGRPFLVRKRFGPGSVSLLAGGLNGAGNNIVVREFYPPFLVRLFSDAAAGGVFPRTVACGEPIRVRIPDTARSVAFQAEGSEPVPITPRKERNELVAEVPGGLDRTALCSFLVGGAEGASRTWLGVQGERADSDLTPLDPVSKQKLIKKWGIVEAPDWPRLDEALRAGRRGGERHQWVVLALVALLFGEMLVQRRFA